MTEVAELVARLRIGDPGADNPDWEVVWVQNLRTMLEDGTFSTFRDWHAIFLADFNSLLSAASEGATALTQMQARVEAAEAERDGLREALSPNANLATSLADMLRIIEAVRLSAGLGAKQVARYEAARRVLREYVDA